MNAFLDGGGVAGAVIGAMALSVVTIGAARAQQGPSLVEVDAVILEPMTQTAPVVGRLVARQAGDVAAQVSGPVLLVLADVGDRVAEGAALIALDDNRLRLTRDLMLADMAEREAALAFAQAELTRAEQDFSRLSNLRGSAAFNEAQFDDQRASVQAYRSSLQRAQAVLARAAASLELADLDLARATVRAPFPGVVSARYVAAGDFVTVGQPVLALIDDGDLEIEAEVPTDRLAGLSEGAILSIELDDGTTHEAVVRAVVPLENPRTRTRLVRLTPVFGDVNKPLAANQTAVVMVPAGPAGDVITVHKDAVIAGPRGTMVYVVVDGAAQMRPVQLGAAVGARFEVLSGLVAGDMTVIRGNERLQPGAQVRVGDGA